MFLYVISLKECITKCEVELKRKPVSKKTDATLLALAHQKKGLSGINEKMMDKLMGKRLFENREKAIKRTQDELLKSNTYQQRMLSVIKN